MKKLRKKIGGFNLCSNESQEPCHPVRFFHCGEYGSKLSRPHHHACLFNMDFSDKYLWKETHGTKLYRSPTLETLWPYGYSSIGDVTFDSAAYVARYIQKKINGKKKEDHYKRYDTETGEEYQLEQEYITMSRRPGIAKNWFRQYAGDVYPKDFLTLGGRKFKVPQFYDNIYDQYEPEKMDRIKHKRRKASLNNQPTMRGLKCKRLVAEQQAKLLPREYENDPDSILNL